MGKKSNWDVLRGLSPKDTMKNRDVHGDQEFERGDPEKPKSATGYIVLTLIVCLFTFAVGYILASGMSFAVWQMKHAANSAVKQQYGNTVDTGQAPQSGTVPRYQKFYDDILGEDWVAPETRQGWCTHGDFRYVCDEYPGMCWEVPPGRDDFVRAEHAKAGTEYVSTKVMYRDIATGEVYDADSLPEGGESARVQVDDGGNYVPPAATAEPVGAAQDADGADDAGYVMTLSDAFRPNKTNLGFGFICAAIVFAIMYPLMMRLLQAQNADKDTVDLNQYKNDQHIALVEEVQRDLEWFPDTGAHSNVQPSTLISHVMILNKGINPVRMARRHEKDVTGSDGDILHYKGEEVLDEDGNVETYSAPLFDHQFGVELYDASGCPEGKFFRKWYDTTKIRYKPKASKRDKQAGNYKTVAEVINNDWTFPEYEVQRPAGAYLVDTNPVNTMVIAITRAGKGQTMIEPTIDMWTRERKPNNIVINDPKGELLQKFYVPATMRGFQVVQFNLINPMKTDIYNRAPRSIVKSYSIAC